MPGRHLCLQEDPDLSPGPAQQEPGEMPIASSAVGPTHSRGGQLRQSPQGASLKIPLLPSEFSPM